MLRIQTIFDSDPDFHFDTDPAFQFDTDPDPYRFKELPNVLKQYRYFL